MILGGISLTMLLLSVAVIGMHAVPLGSGSATNHGFQRQFQGWF